MSAAISAEHPALLAGRRALVAGGSGGLGSAMARSLARAGATVAICGRDQAHTAAQASELSQGVKGRVIPVTLDLLAPGSAQQAVSTAAREMGGLDILVNAAGAAADGRFETVSAERWHDAMAVKLLGTMDMIRAALPCLKSAGRSVIFTLTGLFGVEPSPGHIVSGTINAALGNFMKALAIDVAPYGVRAITVCPGPFMTPRLRAIILQHAQEQGRSYEDQLQLEQAALPMGRFGQPEEMGEIVAMLASAHGEFVTGTTITIDGGMRRSV